MPTRLVREGILSSDKVNRLDWPAEIFYRRLLNKVDDHGLYDARPSILRTSLYPLKVDKVKEKDCLQWLDACRKAGLIVIYQSLGKWYLQVLNTCWNARSDPKYPLPTANSCKQLQTTESIRTVVVDVYVDVNKDVDEIASSEKPLSASVTRVNGEEVVSIPLLDGSEFGLSESDLSELKKAYPALDCKQTVLEIRAWCVANPTRKKTKRGAMRFINSWMARLQDRAH